jgi:hypothetical protein
MKYIQLFESWDSIPAEPERAFRTPRRNMVPDLSSLKDTQEYQDLLAAGFTDVSDENPMGLSQGNLRFTHPALGDMNIRVNQNGSMWHDLPNGKAYRINHPSQPLTSIEDYAARLALLPEML